MNVGQATILVVQDKLSTSKTRLRGILLPQERARFVWCRLHDLLSMFRNVGATPTLFVPETAHTMYSFLDRSDFRLTRDRENTGFWNAVCAAVKSISVSKDAPVLILSSDLALLSEADLLTVFNLLASYDLIVSSTASRGVSLIAATVDVSPIANKLSRNPISDEVGCFETEARFHGWSIHVLDETQYAFDIDTPEDFVRAYCLYKGGVGRDNILTSKFTESVIGEATIMEGKSIFRLTRQFFENRMYLIAPKRILFSSVPNPQGISWVLDRLSSSKRLDSLPMIDTETNVIIDGQHRVSALEALGYHTIPVHRSFLDSQFLGVEHWLRVVHTATVRELKEYLLFSEQMCLGRFGASSRASDDFNMPLQFRTRDSGLTVFFPDQTGLFSAMSELESVAEKRGYEITLAASNCKLEISQMTLVLDHMVPVSAEEAKKCAMSKSPFPTRINRYLVPGRMLDLSLDLATLDSLGDNLSYLESLWFAFGGSPPFVEIMRHSLGREKNENFE